MPCCTGGNIGLPQKASKLLLGGYLLDTSFVHMKIEKFIRIIIFSCTFSSSDPQRARVCSRWGWRAIVWFSPIAFKLQVQIWKALSHFVSHKMCSLWSYKLFQLSALGKAGQAGSCLRANAWQSCDPEQGGLMGALAECCNPSLLPGAQKGKRVPQLPSGTSRVFTEGEGCKQGSISFQSLFWSFFTMGAP